MDKIIPIQFSGLCGNCYLIQNGDDQVLVDTALPSKRKELEKQLMEQNCTPGRLNLILLTHGDFDHSGNALYLKKKYNCPIAMHQEDAPITETGKMFIHRAKKNYIFDICTRLFLHIDRFSPDIFLDDGHDLCRYGLQGSIIHLPVHSPGSIGIRTREGALICGDLFENRKRPRLYFVDDHSQVENCLKKLEHAGIHRIYPGHGSSFMYSDIHPLLKNR